MEEIFRLGVLVHNQFLGELEPFPEILSQIDSSSVSQS